ncbi:hypothetical protein AALO_G00182170 [Alosa alosa]|uniref:FXYD domain-containing ion transport regulator n=1 Tax=Alosa alosa TaxID=278164 RepID=A0AAV6G9X3_9TELE|nr:hypothetical protein AALO_G00182170 [Alosa alosa]
MLASFSSLIQVGMDLSMLAAFCACLGPALGSAFGREMPASSMSHDDYDSPFHYDYESLRIGGLVFAVTLCIVGLLLILRNVAASKHQSQAVVIQRLQSSKVKHDLRTYSPRPGSRLIAHLSYASRESRKGFTCSTLREKLSPSYSNLCPGLVAFSFSSIYNILLGL